MIEFMHEKQEQGAGGKVWEKARVVSTLLRLLFLLAYKVHKMGDTSLTRPFRGTPDFVSVGLTNLLAIVEWLNFGLKKGSTQL